MNNRIVTKDTRNYGIDTLRILAMLGIVMIHILYKGQLIGTATGLKAKGLWVLELIGL